MKHNMDSKTILENTKDQKLSNSYRAGYLGLVGLPNAGKSTLLNALVQEKVAIVSPKPQTTRRRSIGLLSEDRGQIILLDAPGIIEAHQGLNAFLRQEAEDVISQSDALALVLNLDAPSLEDLKEVFNLVVQSNKPWFYVLSKTDLKLAERRKPILISHLKTWMPQVVPGIDWNLSEEKKKSFKQEFCDLAFPLLPESQAPLFDPEFYTTQSMRELVAEFIREKCFLLLEHELPYSIAVRIRKFDESAPVPRVEADILVSKANHKSIVIGKNGQMLKQIGSLARAELEALLGKKCYLGLQVVVRENWQRNPGLMRDLGYEVVPVRKG